MPDISLVVFDINDIIEEEEEEEELENNQIKKINEPKKENSIFVKSIEYFIKTHILLDIEREEFQNYCEYSFIYQIEKGVAKKFRIFLFSKIVKDTFTIDSNALFILIDLEKKNIKELLTKVVGNIKRISQPDIRIYILGFISSKDNELVLNKENIVDLFNSEDMKINYKEININGNIKNEIIDNNINIDNIKYDDNKNNKEKNLLNNNNIDNKEKNINNKSNNEDNIDNEKKNIDKEEDNINNEKDNIDNEKDNIVNEKDNIDNEKDNIDNENNNIKNENNTKNKSNNIDNENNIKNINENNNILNENISKERNAPKKIEKLSNKNENNKKDNIINDELKVNENQIFKKIDEFIDIALHGIYNYEKSKSKLDSNVEQEKCKFNSCLIY